MKQKIDIKDLDINQAPICYLVETDEPCGYIVAKGTLRELETASIGTQWAYLFRGTFGAQKEDKELWPEEFNYVVVMRETPTLGFDGYGAYNYDCDLYGVYCPPIRLEELLGSGDISINEILGGIIREQSGAVTLYTDSDTKVTLHIISEDGIKQALGPNLHLEDTKLSSSYRCSCEHDCCGHISSIEIKDNNNGWISIFLTTRYNY